MNESSRDAARAAIRHLQGVYNNAGDRGRIDEVLGTFAPDGVLEVPGARLAGHAAIAGFLSGVVDRDAGGIDLRGSRHHLTTGRIEFESPTQAQGWTYFFVMRRGEVIQEGSYVDRFVATDNGWRIAHRRVKLIWTKGD